MANSPRFLQPQDGKKDRKQTLNMFGITSRACIPLGKHSDPTPWNFQASWMPQKLSKIRKASWLHIPLRPSALYYRQGLFDDRPSAGVTKARSPRGRAPHSLDANWKNCPLPVLAALVTSSHTVQTLLAGKLARAPENYKTMNFAWTREIARVNYEPLFRHIGEEDITILNTQTYYQACQIHASGYNTARRPRNFFRNWHWWNFMNKQKIPLARCLWTSISQSSSKSRWWSSPQSLLVLSQWHGSQETDFQPQKDPRISIAWE